MVKTKKYEFRVLLPRAACLTGLLLNFAGTAAAADAPSPGAILQQIMPQQALPVAPDQIQTLPAKDDKATASDASLKVEQITIEGNTLVDSSVLFPLVEGLSNRIVKLNELQQAAERITAIYHASGYPLAYAYLPAQTVRDGQVKIKVVEPSYEQILISSGSRLKAEQARNTLGLESGETIEQVSLDRGMQLLNQTPGIRVSGTLVPGAKPATSSMAVNITDTPLFRGRVGLDNHGNRHTGRGRFLANAALDNPFGYGSRLAANVLTTEGGLMGSAGFNVLSPDLYQGLRTNLYGSATRYDLGGIFSSLGIDGDADQIGIGVAYPLVLKAGKALNVRADLVRNTFSQQSEVVSLDSRYHVNLLSVGLDGALADKHGGTTSGSIKLSRGNLVLDSRDAQAADAARSNAAGGFWVTRFLLQRDQLMPRNHRLQASLSGQLASHNLDSSEKFFLGGPDAVMSNPVGDLGGDSGIMMRLRVSHDIPLSVPGKLEGAILFQAGQIWVNHSPLPFSDNRQSLASGGLELKYTWSDRLSAQVDYAHRIGSAPRSSSSDDADQIWASLNYSF